jgi:hypothetical protein
VISDNGQAKPDGPCHHHTLGSNLTASRHKRPDTRRGIDSDYNVHRGRENVVRGTREVPNAEVHNDSKAECYFIALIKSHLTPPIICRLSKLL